MLKDLREFVSSEEANAAEIKERIGAVQKASLKVFDTVAEESAAAKEAEEGEKSEKKADDAEFEDVKEKKKD